MFLDLTGVYRKPTEDGRTALIEYDWLCSVGSIKDVVNNRETGEVGIRLHSLEQTSEGLESEQVQVTEAYEDVIAKLRACDVAVF